MAKDKKKKKPVKTYPISRALTSMVPAGIAAGLGGVGGLAVGSGYGKGVGRLVASLGGGALGAAYGGTMIGGSTLLNRHIHARALAGREVLNKRDWGSEKLLKKADFDKAEVAFIKEYFDFAEKKDPGYWASNMAASRARRESDKGFGKLIAKPELIKARIKGKLVGGGKGLAAGAAAGAVAGAAITKSRVGAGIGATLSGLYGGVIGGVLGRYQADKKYLKKAPKGFCLF